MCIEVSSTLSKALATRQQPVLARQDHIDRTESKLDYIVIRSGQYNYSLLLGYYFGTKSQFSVISTGSKLRICFVTDGSLTYQGSTHHMTEAVYAPYTTGSPTTYPWLTTPSNCCIREDERPLVVVQTCQTNKQTNRQTRVFDRAVFTSS